MKEKLILRNEGHAPTVWPFLPEGTGIELKPSFFSPEFFGQLAAWILGADLIVIFALCADISIRGMFGYHLVGIVVFLTVFAVAVDCFCRYWYGESYRHHWYRHW